MNLIAEVVEAAPAIAAIRKQLHAHPEIGFHEEHSADLIAKTLQSWGIEVHRGLAGTGLVGVIRNGDSKRAVGLRADMDALPINEQNTFAHTSTNDGIMHGCGHDGHMAMLLAAAQYLQRHKSFNGTVYLIFQPAEEAGAGAHVMMEDGLFKRFPMDAVFGLHNWPMLPAGTMAVSPGAVMAASSDFKLRIEARGAHAALPHTGIDPIPIACQIVMGWQTISSRSKDPAAPAVLSATCIQAGDAVNVIPDVCTVRGTVRTFTHEVTDLFERHMRDMAQHICAAYGATCHFDFNRTYVPTVNHPKEAAFARDVMISIVGADRVLPQPSSLTAEDFGYMLETMPGAYAFVSNGDGASHRTDGQDTGSCMLHNASYDFNDAIIPLGATYWIRLAERFLAAAEK